MCGLIACLNAACWSIVTPAFQVPDELDHYAYVKQLAETGTLPSSDYELSSNEIIAVLLGLNYQRVREQPENRSIASPAEQDELRALPVGVGQRRRRRQPRGRRRGLRAAALLRARVDPLRDRQGRNGARPAPAHAMDLGAVRRLDRAVHVHVRARGASRRAVGVDGRGPGSRARAAARLHVGRGQPRRDAVRRLGGALLLSARARFGAG